MRSITLWLGSVIGVCVSLTSAYAQPESIILQGVVPYNLPANVTVPVVVPIPAALPDACNLTAHVNIAGQTGPQRVTAQYEPADPIAGTPDRAWLQWTGSAENRGKTITIRFEPNSDKSSSPFTFTNANPQLHLTNATSQPVLSFWHGQPESGQRYPLTDYIHPIIGLAGETLTDMRPDDHIHHRGVFWAWPRYERQGHEIGAWWVPTNIHCEPGTIESSTGLVFARFHARHFLVHQPAGSETGEHFIREDVVCRIFRTSDFGRAIDLEILLTALEKGVRIGGTTALNKGYGGLTVRTAPAHFAAIEADGVFLPNDGIRHRAGWADWNGFYKELANRGEPGRSGIAVLVHPSHPDVPTEWLLRHYGILNVAFPGLDMLEIPTDKPLRLRYRLWIHRGNATQGRVDAQYRSYSANWQWNVKH